MQQSISKPLMSTKSLSYGGTYYITFLHAEYTLLIALLNKFTRCPSILRNATLWSPSANNHG